MCNAFCDKQLIESSLLAHTWDANTPVQAKTALLAVCEQKVTQGFTSRDTDAVQLLILGALGSVFDEIFTPKLEESWENLLRQGALVSGVGMNFFRQIQYLHRCCLNLSHPVQIAN